MRKWVLAAFVSCAVLVAQTKPTDVFEKAPPQVDEALRQNVAKFYQAHVDGKFRNAEAVIAEDSKDTFYNLEKQRYFSFEIVRINYSENFTKAAVVTGVEVEWRTPRTGCDACQAADDQSLEARERRVALVCCSAKRLGHSMGTYESRS